jgi:hypothetical protein
MYIKYNKYIIRQFLTYNFIITLINIKILFKYIILIFIKIKLLFLKALNFKLLIITLIALYIYKKSFNI